ncbi:hypothetical protein BCR34DRAFT_601686 [Clohesyomyces aquaticus]|uniref:Uncharacterized protein n=1 Tax=Clohesyomyces aquaticus TaxID=1231657 RepID=A0A1Y1ZL11_9PLEO|nr:hypothetical protein BCR34DRAFT_601686 [Clohesyomyces aquaticus]
MASITGFKVAPAPFSTQNMQATSARHPSKTTPALLRVIHYRPKKTIDKPRSEFETMTPSCQHVRMSPENFTSERFVASKALNSMIATVEHDEDRCKVSKAGRLDHNLMRRWLRTAKAARDPRRSRIPNQEFLQGLTCDKYADWFQWTTPFPSEVRQDDLRFPKHKWSTVKTGIPDTTSDAFENMVQTFENQGFR